MMIETVEGEFYRSSQAANIEHARAHKATAYMDLFYGYSSAMDGLTSMEQVANMMEHNSHRYDIRIVLTINDNIVLPECYLGEAYRVINNWVMENTK